VLSVRRCKNSAAHALVGIARKFDSKSWFINVSFSIYSIICKESGFYWNWNEELYCQKEEENVLRNKIST